ncbi:hypothetical protein GCM10010483_32000 [Actinokineospora diospyrosa]
MVLHPRLSPSAGPVPPDLGSILPAHRFVSWDNHQGAPDGLTEQLAGAGDVAVHLLDEGR